MPEPKHYHKLKRGVYRTGTPYFKCVDCPFVVTVVNVVGRPVRCWKCNNPFIFARNDAKWAKPTCTSCRVGLAAVPGGAMDELLDDIVKEDKR